VTLTVEKLFIFNVDVLSMVLYRRRSFETTVKIRPITGSRRKETEVARRIKAGNEKEGDRSSQ